jgi:class 3 adenylate cyclase
VAINVDRMPELGPKERAGLPDSAFAYVDSKGRRRLPINDEAHVRNALARFGQVRFENESAREKARTRLLRAAKKHGIVPVGFITGQFAEERDKARSGPVDLPTGLLTMLMTDIEGSTALLAHLGDRYERVLTDVRSRLRRSVRQSGGRQVDVRGDEFFAVFGAVDPAIEAAVALQQAIARHKWPDGLEVRVRSAIHHGPTTLTDEGYIGLAVHTTSRLCAAAHGGQIVISDEARRGMKDHAARSLRSLGIHRLRGLAEPVEVFQVETPDLAADFPPLRPAVATRVRRAGSRDTS